MITSKNEKSMAPIADQKRIIFVQRKQEWKGEKDTWTKCTKNKSFCWSCYTFKKINKKS